MDKELPESEDKLIIASDWSFTTLLLDEGDDGGDARNAHENGDDPANDGDEWFINPLPHNALVATDEQDEDEYDGCDDAVGDGGVDEGFDGIEAEEVDAEADEHGDNDDAVEGVGLLEVAV